jgi:hypothetical protein
MELWNQEFKEAANYHTQLVSDVDCKYFRVQKTDSEAPPRIFDQNGRCSCNARVSFLFPCAHEICADGYSFVLSRVNGRWIKRASLTSSSIAGNQDGAESVHNRGIDNDDDHGGIDPEFPSAQIEDEITKNAFLESQLPTQDENHYSHTQPSQGPKSTNRNRSQEYNELMGLFQQLAQAAAGSKFGSVVGGIAIQLTKAIEGTANVEVGDGTWPSILKVFGGALESYRSAFSGRRNVLPAASTGVPLQPLSQVGRPQTLRLQSNVELASRKRKNNVSQTCGFCGALDHQRQTSCPVMAALGVKILNMSTFLSYLMGNAPCLEWGGRSEPVLKNVPTGGKHIVIHRKFYTYIAAGSKFPELLHTVYEATLIEKNGLALPNYRKVFFEGPAIICHLGSIGQMKVKNRHVFSTMQDWDGTSGAVLGTRR